MRRYSGIGGTQSRKIFTTLILILVLSGIPAAGAAEITLSTPHSEYYILTGQDAIIPLTVASTYDHDITGTLTQITVPTGTGTTGSRDAITQARPFSAFTEQRTVPLTVAGSDVPAVYQVSVAFSYPEEGGRIAALGAIVVHFVSKTEEIQPAGGQPIAGSDMAYPVSASSAASGTPPPTPGATQDPGERLQNSQIAQDTSALRGQMAQETNASGADSADLLAYILSDPLVISLNQSLAGAGFEPGRTEIIPASSISGRFLLTYASGAKTVEVRGSLREKKVLFAEESSRSPFPLPEALQANGTYRQYAGKTGENGFHREETKVNLTPGRAIVNLTYAGAQNRNLGLDAEIVNGSVTAIAGDDPTDPLAPLVTPLSLAAILLLSAGIWYLARRRREEPPPVREEMPLPVSHLAPREVAEHLLAEAEEDASRGSWPEAYRKTGRALRIFLSHERGSGREITTEDAGDLIGPGTGDREEIRTILERCTSVGFAKGMPEAEECREMIRASRAFLDTYSRGVAGPDPAGRGKPPGEGK